MNGAYILSQLRNGPSHTSDISTTDGCNFQSDRTHSWLSYFHLLTLSFSHTRSVRVFLFPLLPFSEILLLATSCYQSLLRIPAFCLFFFFPPFDILLSFLCDSPHFFFSLSFLTFTSHLISSSPFCGLSPPALFLSVSVFTCSIH